MWHFVEGGNDIKPLEVDDTSSRAYVYLRKDFNYVEEQDLGDGTIIPAHWTWMEKAIAVEDWELYAKVLGHDADLDDVYSALTELAELIVGGE